jgi:hypothetical protein
MGTRDRELSRFLQCLLEDVGDYVHGFFLSKPFLLMVNRITFY